MSRLDHACRLACMLLAGGVPAQEPAVADVFAAFDRWTGAWFADEIDLTDDVQSPPRLPRQLVADAQQPLGELLQFRQLVDAAVATGSRAAIDRLLRVLGLRLPGGRWRWDQRVAREVVEWALAGAPPAVQAHLFDVARGVGDAAVRAHALRLLAAGRQRFFGKAIEALLEDAQPSVRAAAARALGELGTASAAVPLAMMLRVETEAVCIAAPLGSLAALLCDGAVPARARALAIRAAAAALARTEDVRLAVDPVRFLDGHRDAGAVPALIGVLERTAVQVASTPVQARALRDLRHEAPRTLRDDGRGARRRRPRRLASVVGGGRGHAGDRGAARRRSHRRHRCGEGRRLLRPAGARPARRLRSGRLGQHGDHGARRRGRAPGPALPLRRRGARAGRRARVAAAGRRLLARGVHAPRPRVAAGAGPSHRGEHVGGARLRGGAPPGRLDRSVGSVVAGAGDDGARARRRPRSRRRGLRAQRRCQHRRPGDRSRGDRRARRRADRATGTRVHCIAAWSGTGGEFVSFLVE